MTNEKENSETKLLRYKQSMMNKLVGLFKEKSRYINKNGHTKSIGELFSNPGWYDRIYEIPFRDMEEIRKMLRMAEQIHDMVEPEDWIYYLKQLCISESLEFND